MSVPRPEIVWYGAARHNYESGRNARVGYEAIFVHTTAGGSTIQQLADWFGGTHHDRDGNLIRGSTQYGVDRDGAIGQFVSLDDTPIAHGQRTGHWSGELFDENRGISANLWGIGIEHLDAGTPGSLTDVQFEASAWLSAWLFDALLFPSSARPAPIISRRHVLGHYQADSLNRPFCPSWPEERFTRYIARVAAIVETGTPQPPRDLVRELVDVLTIELRQHRENAAAETMRADHLQGVIDALGR